METIYTKIKDAVVNSKIEGIRYEENYPRDYVCLTKTNDEILDDETIDTLTPLVKALEIITKTIKENATSDDDIVVKFYNNPCEERWEISIGDGR